MSNSLSKFLCQNRSQIHTLFRKMPDWSVSLTQFSIVMKRDDLLIVLQLIGPAIVYYSYKDAYISVSVDVDGRERVLSQEGDVSLLQKQLIKLIDGDVA